MYIPVISHIKMSPNNWIRRQWRHETHLLLLVVRIPTRVGRVGDAPSTTMALRSSTRGCRAGWATGVDKCSSSLLELRDKQLLRSSEWRLPTLLLLLSVGRASLPAGEVEVRRAPGPPFTRCWSGMRSEFPRLFDLFFCRESLFS